MTTPSTAEREACWEPWTATPDEPWDARRVAHLHRRAGFAANRGEIERDRSDGPRAAVDRVLGGGRDEARAAEVDRTAAALADAAVAANDVGRLKAWWVYRMLFGDPLTERLTLLWHDHFATGHAKVADVGLMRRQNDTFRRFGRGPFGPLLSRAVKDPALLLFLDAQANRKEHPNENLARELMELFTLGVGHYGEGDVKEAARALTGWSIWQGKFHEYRLNHDPGEKTVLGRTGRWRGDNVLRILLGHSAVARRLAWRVCGLFMSEGAVTPAEVDALADGLRARELDVGWAVAAVLRSRAFFAERNVGGRVLDPAGYVIGSVRALEMSDPPPVVDALAAHLAALGQDLFEPPSVFGWPGGRGWVSTRTMIGRINFAAALVDGSLRRPAEPLDALGLAGRYGSAGDGRSLAAFFAGLLWGGEPADEPAGEPVGPPAAGALSPAERARAAVTAMLAAPEAQVA